MNYVKSVIIDGVPIHPSQRRVPYTYINMACAYILETHILSPI